MKLLTVAMLLLSLLSGCQSHGPARADDPQTNQALRSSIPSTESIEWFHPAWWGRGTAGILVITTDKLFFQISIDDETYTMYRRIQICEIENILIKEGKRQYNSFTIITDRPDSFSINTPFGAPAFEEAAEVQGLLLDKWAACDKGD